MRLSPAHPRVTGAAAQALTPAVTRRTEGQEGESFGHNQESRAGLAESQAVSSIHHHCGFPSPGVPGHHQPQMVGKHGLRHLAPLPAGIPDQSLSDSTGPITPTPMTMGFPPTLLGGPR